MKATVYVSRNAEHALAGKTLIATTENSASSYGLPVVLDQTGSPVGPNDLLDGPYGSVTLGYISIAAEDYTDDFFNLLVKAGYSVNPPSPCGICQ